jgi:hypothetical protein
MSTTAEQGILARHIRRFFQVGDRSPARAEIIREALDLLNAEDRHWTAESVRLWFTNNKKHYIDDSSTTASLPVRAISIHGSRDTM